MDTVLDFLFGKQPLNRHFVRVASKFYSNPNEQWEPVTDTNGKTYYFLKNDPNRRLVLERMMAMSARCDALWRKLQKIEVHPKREIDVKLLRNVLQPKDGIVHIAQKPPGGYDVMAYAQDDWVFIQIPTFPAIEDGSDGVNTSESMRRNTLWDIMLHELAHAAGYWNHDTQHEATIAWLQNVDAMTA